MGEMVFREVLYGPRTVDTPDQSDLVELQNGSSSFD